MITYKMSGMTMKMNDAEFCNMMCELAKSVVNDNKDWQEYLAEIKFELVSVEK